MGATVCGAYGAASAASAATVDANNRQLHPTEAKLIKENARRFAQKLYGTDQPTSEQIAAAQAMLTNTVRVEAGNPIDGYKSTRPSTSLALPLSACAQVKTWI